eukprot:scaffold803_cov310-Pinguiococcus_pyrenoidosus.AAC.210
MPMPATPGEGAVRDWRHHLLNGARREVPFSRKALGEEARGARNGALLDLCESNGTGSSSAAQRLHLRRTEAEDQWRVCARAARYAPWSQRKEEEENPPSSLTTAATCMRRHPAADSHLHESKAGYQEKGAARLGGRRRAKEVSEVACVSYREDDYGNHQMSAGVPRVTYAGDGRSKIEMWTPEKREDKLRHNFGVVLDVDLTSFMVGFSPVRPKPRERRDVPSRISPCCCP